MKKDVIAVGTVAYDSIETPHGKRERILGGSATHFLNALLAKGDLNSSVVGIVGNDFSDEKLNFFKKKNIDITDLEIKKDGKTFFWEGSYEGDMNEAHSKITDLNVLMDFNPQLSEPNKETDFLFLGNIDPDLQLSVLDQVDCRFSFMDTMNFWLEIKKDTVLKVLEKIDCLVLNDGESFLLTGEANYLKAAEKILELGPEYVIIKKGSHGSTFFSKDGDFFQIPAFPVKDVVDPTGAGDSFAGGFISYLVSAFKEGRVIEGELFKEALSYATIVASFYVQGFGVEGLKGKTLEDISSRFQSFFKYSSFPKIL